MAGRLDFWVLGCEIGRGLMCVCVRVCACERSWLDDWVTGCLCAAGGCSLLQKKKKGKGEWWNRTQSQAINSSRQLTIGLTSLKALVVRLLHVHSGPAHERKHVCPLPCAVCPLPISRGVTGVHPLAHPSLVRHSPPSHAPARLYCDGQ